MPKKVCCKPGCGKSIRRGSRCDEHQTFLKRAKHTDKRLGRLTAHQRGYGHRWRKYRLQYLKRNPLCVHCLDAGVTTAANEVDHKIRHNGPEDPLFWDKGNHQGLCKPCHSAKTRREAHLYQ